MSREADNKKFEIQKLFKVFGPRRAAGGEKTPETQRRTTTFGGDVSEKSVKLTPGIVARHIEHTLLHPSAGPTEIEVLCREAVEHGFLGVCVNPWLAGYARDCFGGSTPLVVAVAGFPLGATFSAVKAREADLAMESGADEVDMVMNIGALLAGKSSKVSADIREVVRAVAPAPVKVIIETGLLDTPRKREACLIARDAGAAFVKTCTGFSGGGATVADIRLMRETVGPDMGIKASGGIRTLDMARGLIRAGADRIGASASVDIVSANEPGDGEA